MNTLLNGWSLIELNDAHMQFVNGKLKVDVMIVYPTMTTSGKQNINTYIDKHRVGYHHTSIKEAMEYVASDRAKWFDRGYRKGCDYAVTKEHSYNHWMSYYKITEEQEDWFEEGWSKAHGV